RDQVAERVRTAAETDIVRPAGLGERLEPAAHGRAEARRARHARFEIPVADAGHGHVDREQHRRAAGLRCTVYQITHERAVANDVELEPERPSDGRANLLDAADRYGRKAEGHVRARRRLRSLHFAAAGEHPGNADRPETERHRPT